MGFSKFFMRSMNYFFSSVLLCLLLISCFQKEKDLSSSLTADNAILKSDTSIGSITITNQIPGAAYRRRAKGYFVIIDNDTSSFTCIFTEAKEGEQVDITFYNTNTRQTTYRQRMQELKKILPEAAKNFILDSLHSIDIGLPCIKWGYCN